MSHTYTANLLHVVFSTKHRRDLIPPEVQPRLWGYMAEIGRNRAVHILAVGGIANHAHVLLSLPPVMPLAKAVQALKRISSKWMNEIGRDFAWQEGYAAFSVGRSQVSSVIGYVNSQPEHHRKHSFESEFLSLLAKHGRIRPKICVRVGPSPPGLRSLMNDSQRWKRWANLGKALRARWSEKKPHSVGAQMRRIGEMLPKRPALAPAQ